MQAHHRGLVFGALLLGCGDDTVQPAPLAEVCGAAAPHRVLALDADAAVLTGVPNLVRLEDRIYYIAGAGELGETGPEPRDATVYATGPCGEDPVVVADDVWRVFVDANFPGAVLGCRGALSGDLVELDPTGATPPRLLLADGCGMSFTDHGLLHREARSPSSVRLQIYPYPIAADDQPMVLFDDLAPTTPSSFTRRDDEVLALTPGSDLVRISLVDGDVAFEQSEVRRFELSNDGRFLVWQDFQITGGEPDGPAGAIFVRDLVDGGDTELADSGFARGLPMLLSRDLIQIWLSQSRTRLVALPSLTVHDLSSDQTVYFKVSDGRYLTSTGTQYALLDLDSGESTTVLDEPGFRKLGPEHIDLWQGHYPSDRADAPLWRHFYDGREPVQLAERVGGVFRELGDHRTVTIVELDEQWRGTFIVVDPHTLAEHHIDDHVTSLSVALGDPFGPGTLTYAVTDGDRSGIWIVRLAE